MKNITKLESFAVIKVSGNDAETFLQGQFTNDVRQVTAEQSQLSAWCSSKGRIIVNFRLFMRDNAYYIILPDDSIAFMLKRLQMYVLRADVKLEDVSDKLSCLAVVGDAPENNFAVLQVETGRYLVVVEADVDTYDVDTGKWELLNILAGLPQIVAATAEAFVPQMVNFNAIGGVSFKKGCYTGQEVVARMHYLGTVKRRMFLVKLDTAKLPQPGDELNGIGKIVNAQAHPDGGVVVLAVLKIKEAENDKALQLMELPYKL
ncbi:CAF17-like 4Fe-4S cluster assembly/insertion protein YgfZ [Candidatus Marithrix sp. Canyon 246]|uniref:CAF17-like 4Fe-4S cluster assembly/insertion protein YgfZ n=1 Tax=Candidatus Marithrix sp. Canyon 246 TaxID=1827136 RepID=UPI00084A26B8|nr:folate-binding protein YgfZ [Candidatus Marithrix sp. Canyon 246]